MDIIELCGRRSRETMTDPGGGSASRISNTKRPTDPGGGNSTTSSKASRPAWTGLDWLVSRVRPKSPLNNLTHYTVSGSVRKTGCPVRFGRAFRGVID